MITYAIVPVKEFDRAKSRLSANLKPAQRKGLLISMLDDVLTALSDIQVILISPEDISNHVGKRKNVKFILQAPGGDLNSAVREANDLALREGADSTLFVPADMPLITKKDINDILGLGKKHALIITQSTDGGTGILYRRPPGIIDSRFTSNSFQDHIREAAENGVEVFIFDSFPLSLDIDCKDDIKCFLNHGEGTSSYGYLKDLLDK
jgi:2-phospho-L-lactate guanylyltransferase